MICRRLLSQALRQVSIKALTPHRQTAPCLRLLCSSPPTNSEQLLEKLSENWPAWRVAPSPDDHSHHLQVLSFLTLQRIPKNDLLRILLRDPSMLKHSLDTWQSRLALLGEYGFKPSMAFRLLHDHRELWTGGEKKLYDTMSALRLLGFIDGQLQRYYTRCRALFDLTSEQIHMPHNVLIKYFSQAKCLKILTNNLRIFDYSVDEIEEKLMYVFKDMGIDDDDNIIDSSLLDHSVMHIRTRHVLLQRAGLFVRPNKKGETLVENPTLAMILDTTDAEFAADVCGMTLAEVVTFTKLFAREQNVHSIEEAETDEDDSDDESEDEADGSSYRKFKNKR